MTRSLTTRSARDFIRDDAGTTAIEYSLIATGIAVAIIAVVSSLGTEVQTMFQSVATALAP
ncbi:MAG TPA: Flp family type IVb pilin [Pseudolabrys sp.]|jgi:pilus assembly protein Flp/PilA